MPKETLQEKADRLERELAQEKAKSERLVSYLNESNNGMCLLDLEGNVLEINKMGASLIGYKREEIVNQNIELINSPGTGDRLRSLLNKLKNEREVYQYEGIIQKKTGELIEIHFNGKTINQQDRTVVIGTFHDITEINNLKRKLEDYNKHLDQKIKDKTYELELTQEVSILALARLAEINDSDTCEHLMRIKDYSELLGNEAKKNSSYSTYLTQREDYIISISLASILHDIGKVAVPETILHKEAKLSPGESILMQEHTTNALKFLNEANQRLKTLLNKESYFALAYEIAHYHHERWDGTGYPDGLAGEEIPLSARIVSIVDVYDALRSKRSYKDAWSHEKTISYMESQSGKHFDPILLECFLRKEKEIEKRYSLLCHIN